MPVLCAKFLKNMRHRLQQYAIYALKYAENMRIGLNALKKRLYALQYAETPVLCGEKICGAYTKNSY